MKTTSLPRWMARLFAFLFYGQIVGYVLFAGIMVYVITFGMPNAGTFNVTAEINSLIIAPNAPLEKKKALEDWSKSTFDLTLGVPGSISHSQSEPALLLNLSFNGPTDLAKLPSLLLFSMGSGLLLAFLILFVSYQFMKLFNGLADQHIFDQLQVSRLMFIGYSLLGYAGLSVVMKQLVEKGAIIYLERFGYAVSKRQVYNIGFGLGSPSAEVMSVLAGLCILALAQVFKYGMELKQENELTV